MEITEFSVFGGERKEKRKSNRIQDNSILVGSVKLNSLLYHNNTARIIFQAACTFIIFF
jgi:hypothetical protein